MPEAGDRAALRAEIAARAAQPVPSLRPAALVADGPLRPLPGDLLAVLEARTRAGYGSPSEIRSGLRSRHDPLRLDRRQQRQLTEASTWQSRQTWPAPLLGSPERALVTLAVEVVGEIAASPVWRSGYLDGHRLELDLAAELDDIDAQALQVAQLSATGAAAADAGAGLDSCLDRVLALRAYAQGLAALGARIAAADAEIHAAPAIGELRGRDEGGSGSLEQLARLTGELGVLGSAVEQTAAEVRSERRDP